MIQSIMILATGSRSVSGWRVGDDVDRGQTPLHSRKSLGNKEVHGYEQTKRRGKGIRRVGTLTRGAEGFQILPFRRVPKPHSHGEELIRPERMRWKNTEIQVNKSSLFKLNSMPQL